MTDEIGYRALTQAAMKGVMKEALKIAATGNGLPGDHHFYITFRTRAAGVKMAPQLVQRFPEEMTIVVQHQFWDLEIHERHFELVLQFSGVPQHLHIPYAAVSRFYDPSVEFGIGFDPATVQTQDSIDTVSELAAPKAPAQDSGQESRPASDGTVVSLDQFRRK